jgi:hypothetical protein
MGQCLTWLALLIYLFPLMLAQEVTDLRQLARDAALLLVGRPIFTLLNLALMLLTLWGSLLLIVPVLAITPALLNVWSARATQTLIDDARRREVANRE